MIVIRGGVCGKLLYHDNPCLRFSAENMVNLESLWATFSNSIGKSMERGVKTQQCSAKVQQYEEKNKLSTILDAICVL